MINRQVFLGSDADKVLAQTTNTGSFAMDIPECLMKFNVSPDKLLLVTQRAQAILGKIVTALLADPGFGVIRLACNYSGIMSTLEFASCVRSLRDMISEQNGSLILERCTSHIKEELDVWGNDTPEVKVMNNIKNQFDPNMILNAGRFMGRL
jgi:glycolate oxidase FAD binding subunit